MNKEDFVRCRHCTRAYTSCPYYQEDNDSCKGLTLKKRERNKKNGKLNKNY